MEPVPEHCKVVADKRRGVLYYRSTKLSYIPIIWGW